VALTHGILALRRRDAVGSPQPVTTA
jgi:hypothetical protein